MTRIKLRYVQRWVDRGGRAHHFFRRRGYKCVKLPGLPGSPEFMAAYQAAMGAAPAPVGVTRNKPGTVAAAVAAFLDSTLYFGSRAPGTQAMRRAILERFREQYGDLPIALLSQQFVVEVVSRMKPHAARNWLKTMRAFCQFARLHGLMKEDPTQGVKLQTPKSDGHRVWTEDEVTRYEARHPIGTKPRLALALGKYTWQRREDVIRMGRQHVRVNERGQRELHIRQQKTRTEIVLPVRPELWAIIEATPGEHLTFLTTKTGKPYSGNDFSEQFRQWCDQAGLPRQLSFHGLRKYGLTWGSDHGMTTHELAAWSGHKSLKMVEHYTRTSDRRRAAREAFERTMVERAGGDQAPDDTKREQKSVSEPNH